MRSSNQQHKVDRIVEDTVLFGYLYPRLQPEGSNRRHKLDPSSLEPIVRFIVEACISGITWDMIRNGVEKLLAGKRRIGIYERGHTDIKEQLIHIGLKCVSYFVVTTENIHTFLESVRDYLEKEQHISTLKKIPPLMRTPKRTRKAMQRRSQIKTKPKRASMRCSELGGSIAVAIVAPRGRRR